MAKARPVFDHPRHDMVPIADLVAALLEAERRTTDAKIDGMAQAVTVFASTADKLLSLHNDLIRKNERSTADTKAEMATKTEVEPLKAFVAGEMQSKVTSGKMWGAIIVAVTLSLSVGFGLANLLQ